MARIIPLNEVMPMKYENTLSSPEATAPGLLDTVRGLIDAFNSVRANILMVDPRLNIVFANESALETLRNLADEVENAFGVTVDDIVGGSVHRFHKNPRGLEKLLRTPRALPYEGRLSFGGVTLKGTLNDIRDAAGGVIGYIAHFEDVTAADKAAAEEARFSNMIENVPINVMFADRDMTLLYMNPASARTLAKLEHHLPVRVDKMVGQKIDIFHKNPDHQRRLMSDQ